MSNKLRVAISGGGVAGASMIHALLNYSHIDAHIFESAPSFREAGIAFGLARNATRALGLIGPSATECLASAGGVPMLGVHFVLGQGPNAGDQVYEADVEQRGHATTTLKKLQSVERRADGSLLIQFSDGTSHECDILIGADGIGSSVRKEILEAEDSACIPHNSGAWVIMKLFPSERAQAVLGDAPISILNAREYGWLAQNTFILHNILSDGDLVQYAVCGYDEDAVGSDRRQRLVTRDQLREMYNGKGWLPHLERGVEELLCNEERHDAWYLAEHPPARTYISGPICVVGDAAHATTAFQGSGGGMCIEDSMILSSLLGRASSPAEALVALEVYDQVRRPRTQEIVKSSWDTGKIFMALDQDTNLDAEKLKAKLRPRWDFIVDFDIEKSREEALKLFDTKVKTALGK
ncbi:salicylate hydroxylase [Dissoconium aciculare CBS 342.82]|uniref:Salicylate hydroxylase n=1 Tax=Dissoconium aciculare CBS 342.82 TaxID=1314786 RepID=A0A6J3LVT5_9PEZI|nr:salicylate hydroxylase [Dissoconium aciculare CBS 342.82]KAF1819871.1 salicylate hydroxylase [Dissoconium aciculare CBS 342.82]